MKKRLLYIVLAAVFAAALVLTAAAAGPVPGDGPAETETSAPVPDPTDTPSDGASDGTAAEIPDGPDAESGGEPGDKTSDESAEDPAEGHVDEPAEEPTGGPVDEPTAAPANIAADEPMAINEDSNVSYVDANGSEQTCTSATVVDGTAAWSNGWYVAKDTVTISQRVTVTGKVDLILADGCSLTVNGGIQVLAGNSLTIWGQKDGTGSLKADGSGLSEGWCAGIGGDADYSSVGAITINGGAVTAIGGDQNAGIGSAGTFEGITINGGTVEASGRVGIGTRGEGDPSGPILITGGTVTASSTGSDGFSIGIGGKVKSITISGGTVNATGGRGCAGIGMRDYPGAIEISGGTVNATGGEAFNAAGAGGAGIGATAFGATVTISGGTVNATGGRGIGSGFGGAGIGLPGGGSITATGGTVTATGGANDYSDVYYGIDGSFSMGENGNALVYSSGITDKSGEESWSGVVFEENKGWVYGSPAPAGSFAVENGQTLTVPEGSTLTVGDGVTLTNDGTIENNGSIVKNGTITGGGKINGTPVEGYELTVTMPAFDEVKYGYARPDAKAITITNTGTAVEHISKVELTSGGDAFELEGSFTGELPKGGSNTSWTIQPKAGLSADGGWTYEATVSVTYDFGHTVTAEVSFTVEQADGTGTVTMGDYTCGDNSVEPVTHSETNWSCEVAYGVKGSGVYVDEKPTVAGEYTVHVLFDDNLNYTQHIAEADFTVTHKFDADWEQREDGSHRTCDGCGTELLLTTEPLTDVPAGLESKYGSVQALTQALAQAVDTGENYAVYDVVLERKEPGGNWHEAAPADFPAEGIPVTLPYPKGTDGGYTFTAVHMFASGERSGETEKPAVKNDAGGVTFTVTGLSPVCIGWKAPAAAPGATAAPAAAAPYTGDESPLLFWTAALCLAGAALGMLLLRRRRG